MTRPDPYWCPTCRDHHVVPSLVAAHQANGGPVNPDCRAEKHRACSGTAWDDDRDALTSCACTCHTTPTGRRPAGPTPDNERPVTGL